MSGFMNPRYASLAPYVPGEQPKGKTYIKLNTNESPYPPAPGVLSACNSGAAKDLRLYSDPALTALKEAIALRFDVAPENVYAGNGSDDCLNFAFMAWGAHGCAFPDVTYALYAVLAALHGVDATVIPLREDFSVDPDALAAGNETLFLANPNAPTGLALPAPVIEDLVRANPRRLVVVDEAYVDFGAQSVVPLTGQYDNLVVVRTFSKSRSLAGARVGFAIANASLIADLEALKYATNPYNVNRLSEACAVAAIQDEAYFAKCCKEITETRAFAAKEFQARGFTFPDSKANFLFVKKEGTDGRAFCQALKEHGILVRHFDGARVQEYNRITIGTKQDMETLFRVIDGL